MELNDIQEGMRLQTHPATDAFMRGDRYGTVVMVGRKYVYLKMDSSGFQRALTPENVLPVD